MPLMALGGLPLLVDGMLTDDPDCCCYVVPPPPACPPCCVQVNWGAFDEAGDLIGAETVGDDSVSVTLTMPTKFSRIVCDGELVIVAFSAVSVGETGGYVFFGPAWGSGGQSPDPAKVFPRGLVDWVGITAAAFAATLELSKCWLDTEAFLGYITIGLDDPEWSLEIDISRCPSPSRCCAGPDCSPCCWEVLPVGPSPIYYDGKVWMVSETVSGYRLLISVDTDGPAGLYCSGEGVTVDFEIIPPRWDAFKEYEAGVTFQDPWTLGSFSPAVNPVGGLVDDNNPPTGSGSIDWGPLPDTEYSLTLAADCADIYCGDYVLGAIAVNVTISESDSVSGTFGFTPCEEDNSECCCPPYCQCDCYWPLSKNFCEDALIDDQFGELYEIGGPTRLVDFLIEITADSDVFCGGTTDTAEIRQHGTAASKHFGICSLNGTILCARTNGIVIDIEDTSQTCIPLTPPHGRVRVGIGVSSCETNLSSISMDFIMPDGPFSAETIDAVRTSCSTIGGTGTRTIDGVTFNWTISGTIEGGRACPCEEIP